ncbi:hypothetical protein C0J52_14737 [Blattella germanica]|nr:hypothetical protein C0J52_14737 [Blattella germanica]
MHLTPNTCFGTGHTLCVACLRQCVRIVLSDIPSAAARLRADLLGLRMADKRTRALFSGRGPGGDLSFSEPTVRNVVYQDDSCWLINSKASSFNS